MGIKTTGSKRLSSPSSSSGEWQPSMRTLTTRTKRTLYQERQKSWRLQYSPRQEVKVKPVCTPLERALLNEHSSGSKLRLRCA